MTNNILILSNYNRQQIQKVKYFDLVTRRKIFKELRNASKKELKFENLVILKHNITIDHFCTGQTLYHSTSRKVPNLN